MAHKSLGGWIIEGVLFLQLKVGSGLWRVTTGDKKDKELTSIFFIGWIEREDSPIKMWTVYLASLSIQFALILNKDR